MSTCLEVLEPQQQPHIPPQSMSSGSGSTQNVPKRKQRTSRPKCCCCCSPFGGARAGQGQRLSLQWKDREMERRAWSRNLGERMAEKGLCQNALGDDCLTSQPALVSIYSYVGGSFKFNLTGFRMGCDCPANLNCTFQSCWECHRNADNIKLAMLSVTKKYVYV